MFKIAELKLQFLTPLFALLVSGLAASASVADDTVDLAVKFPKSEQCRIITEIEHEGSVIVVPDDPQAAPKPLPLKVNGTLKYHQRITNATQAIRYFDVAKADIELDKGETKPELDKTNRLIIARLKAETSGRVEMASVRDTLQQEELELLQTPSDPLSLSDLFYKEALKVGQKWEPSDQALAKFLNVETIDTSDVELTLKKIDRGLARVYVSGSVVASVFDVTTEMSVSGIALIDVKNQQIKNIKVGIDEVRPAGQIEPGFEGRTRIDLGFQYGRSTKQLSNKTLSATVRSKKIQQRLKFVSDAGAYHIIYDPRWKLIAGETDSAIMRFIEKGNLITQCNVVLLPERPANQPLTLDKFKDEIGKAIEADKNAMLVTADTRKTANGLNALNVVVSGEEDGLPVNWFYYHVSTNDGRQITFVFTLAEKASGRAKSVADQLVNEFKFVTPTKKVAKKKSSSNARKR
ncbi:MAG: hypothetical protein AAFN77_07185 [Planctomycetota bacterium]